MPNAPRVKSAPQMAMERLLVLQSLDALEADRPEESELEDRPYNFFLAEPFRLRRWTVCRRNVAAIDGLTQYLRHWALSGQL